MPAPIACLHHLPDPFTGHAGEALRAAGLSLDERHVSAGEPFPDLDEISAIVAFGGYESVTEIERYPYLVEEVELMRSALERQIQIFGICLGGQLLAYALGGEVWHRGPAQPRWPRVRRLESDPVFDPLPDEIPALHWNEDAFSLPPGAVELLSPPEDSVEAFRFGDLAWGTQFHPEIDADIFEGLLDHAAGKVDADGARAQSAPHWNIQRLNCLTLFRAFAARVRAR
jgi:GMP synthase (glutamine-hydrolysing)